MWEVERKEGRKDRESVGAGLREFRVEDKAGGD